MPTIDDDRSVPLASVVVATHNRVAMLGRLLDALEAQVGAPAFEVIVVDDASSDGTSDELRRRAAGSPFPLRTSRVDANRGPAHARNVGWRAAATDVVCFTDDDCVPTPTWLAELTKAAAISDIAQGRTQPNPDQLHLRGPFSRTMVVNFEEGFYETCNIAYRRALLEHIDGFDETFPQPFGEDTDLAWRACEQGATVAFAADALVHHEVWPSDVRAAARDIKRIGGIVHTLAKHPGLRRRIGWGIFVRPTHPAALLAVAGLGTIAVWPGEPISWAAAAAAGLRYAWVCRMSRQPPTPRWRWVLTVPVALALDLYEVSMMTRASVRYRTLLL